MITLNCPQCARTITAADEHAGKKARCPECKYTMVLPRAASPGGAAIRPASAAPRAAPAARPAKTQPPAITPARPASVTKSPPTPRRRPVRQDQEVVELEPVEEELDEVDEPEKARRRQRGRKRRSSSKYADCPECGAPGDAERVSFTWWGGMLGPAMFCHVRCNECGTAYNGRTGNFNTVAIALYVGISLFISIVIGVAVAINVGKH